VPENKSTFELACLSTEGSCDLCQITQEFVLASPSLGLVPEPEMQTCFLHSGTMQSFLFAVKTNREMNNLFTQFEPIWCLNIKNWWPGWILGTKGEGNPPCAKHTREKKSIYLAVGSTND